MKGPKRWIERLSAAPNTRRKQGKSFLRLIAPSILSIFLCTICLAGLTWAWFSDQDSCEAGSIQTAQFTVSVEVKRMENAADADNPTGAENAADANNAENADNPANTDNAADTGNADGSYTLEKGFTYSVKLTAGGTASTGYCMIKVGEKTYYTTQMKPGGTLEFTVDCRAAAVGMTVVPNWMTYSGYSEEATGLLGKTLTDIVAEVSGGAEETQPNAAESGQTGSAEQTESEQASSAEQTEPVQTSPAEQTESGQADPAEQTESVQTDPAETEKAEQTLESLPDGSGAESTESPEPSGEGALTEPMPEEGGEALTQERQEGPQPENTESSPAEA